MPCVWCSQGNTSLNSYNTVGCWFHQPIWKHFFLKTFMSFWIQSPPKPLWSCTSPRLLTGILQYNRGIYIGETYQVITSTVCEDGQQNPSQRKSGFENCPWYGEKRNTDNHTKLKAQTKVTSNIKTECFIGITWRTQFSPQTFKVLYCFTLTCATYSSWSLLSVSYIHTTFYTCYFVCILQDLITAITGNYFVFVFYSLYTGT